jgi:hypothetical protein
MADTKSTDAAPGEKGRTIFGLCETCMNDKACENGEVKLNSFKVKFNKARDTIHECHCYVKIRV